MIEFYDMEEKSPKELEHEVLRVRTSSFSGSQLESPSDRKNEDAVVVCENEQVLVAAAIDGASASNTVTGGEERKGGYFASQAVKTGVEKLFSHTGSAKDLALAINEEIARELLGQGIDANSANPLDLSRGSATLVRLDKVKRVAQFSQAGDTAAIVRFKNGNIELVLPTDPEPLDHEAITLGLEISKKLDVPLSQALRDERVKSLLNRSQELNNREDGSGSGVFNGSANLRRYLRSRELNMEELEDILLLTDGLYLPTEDPEASPDWAEMMRTASEGGIEALHEKVCRLKAEDPEFRKFPRWKKHDDASGILLRIES